VEATFFESADWRSVDDGFIVKAASTQGKVDFEAIDINSVFLKNVAR
jgi:hypothetical protein